MATLTIRNLPQEAHDALRRLAAENRNSMEAEARAALMAHVDRRSPLAVKETLRRFRERLPSPAPAPKADGVEAFLAAKRIEVLFDEGLLSLEDRNDWLARIDRQAVSLHEVQAFFDERWPWAPPAAS